MTRRHPADTVPFLLRLSRFVPVLMSSEYGIVGKAPNGRTVGPVCRYRIWWVSFRGRVLWQSTPRRNG